MNGEELVIQMLDNDKFRIIPERLFNNILMNSMSKFKNSTDDNETENILTQISEFSNLSKIEVLKNEFVNQSKEMIENRKIVGKDKTYVKESVPYSIRKILSELYLGKCQITNFSFFTRNNKPYFEVHHINPLKGNHLKNLLVVSPNTHAQFTQANIEHYFDSDGWLRKVKFNKDVFNVFQIIDELPGEFEKHVHY